MNDFISSSNDLEKSNIIPPNLFEEQKLFILTENKSKDVIQKIYKYANNKFKISIIWITKEVIRFFQLNGKNLYPSCKVYQGSRGLLIQRKLYR